MVTIHLQCDCGCGVFRNLPNKEGSITHKIYLRDESIESLQCVDCKRVYEIQTKKNAIQIIFKY